MNIKKHLPWLGALLPVVNMQAETKPNVVIIYIDDMGIGDIGCYGGKFVPTPNIDKIAQDGLLFNQYYSSAPVSSPSRCGLTTGKFPIEVGINTFLNNIMAKREYMLVVRKHVSSFIEKILRCLGHDFRHDVFKSVVYGEKPYITPEEEKWKSYYDSFMYLMLNRHSPFTTGLVKRFMYLILNKELDDSLLLW